MSFGFSIGDIVAAVQLCHKIRAVFQESRTAHEQYSAFETEIAAFESALCPLKNFAEEKTKNESAPADCSSIIDEWKTKLLNIQELVRKGTQYLGREGASRRWGLYSVDFPRLTLVIQALRMQAEIMLNTAMLNAEILRTMRTDPAPLESCTNILQSLQGNELSIAELVMEINVAGNLALIETPGFSLPIIGSGEYFHDGENSPLVAVKRLNCWRFEDFDKEAVQLKLLAPQRNSHLVKLLATYSPRRVESILFLFATKNLGRFWDNDSGSSGIRRNPWDTRRLMFDFQPRENWHQQTLPQRYATREKGAGHFGRHGDIKPENILWFPNAPEDRYRGHLEISDFGLGRFHRMNAKFGSLDKVRLDEWSSAFGRHGDMKPENILWLPYLHIPEFGGSRIPQTTPKASDNGRVVVDTGSTFSNWISLGLKLFGEGQRGTLDSVRQSLKEWVTSQFSWLRSISRFPHRGKRRHRRSSHVMIPCLLAFATPGTAQPLNSGATPVPQNYSTRSHTVSSFFQSLLQPWTNPATKLLNSGTLLTDLFLCTFITVLLITIRRHDKEQKHFLTAGILVSITLGAFCACSLQDFVFWWIFGGVNASLGLSVLYHAWHSRSGMKTHRCDIIGTWDREMIKLEPEIFVDEKKRGM